MKDTASAQAQARIERLERENLRMRERLHRLEAALGVQEGHVPPEVAAGAFRLIDPQGRQRACLALADHGPELTLYDLRGRLRARLGMVAEGVPGQEHGPAFTLFDEEARPLASLFLGQDEGGGLGPVLSLTTPVSEVARVILTAGRAGGLAAFYDLGGAARAELRVEDRAQGEPRLILRPAGGVAWTAGPPPPTP